MNNNSSTKDLSLSSNERLYLKNKSTFFPKKYSNLKPNGLRIFTFHAGFKRKLNDLLILIFDKPAKSFAVFSKTTTPSAPIIWDKKYNKGFTKVLVINSGNANAHTGVKGIKLINNYVNFLVKLINCKKTEVFVSSTGVIGEIFNPEIIKNQIPNIVSKTSGNLKSAAEAIMTTDTYPKIAVKNVSIGKQKFKIYGIAKGSGMIFPNMGTMLAYIFIEAKLSKNILKKLMKENLENTFNSISTDGDMSTSDTLVLFSLDEKKINISSKKNYEIINKSLNSVMRDLSLQIVKDGEGISKLIQVNVNKSKTIKQAKNIAFSVINSPLVKTAISGEDANWGRIIAAIGKTQENIEQNKLKIFFGGYLVCQNGAIYKKINFSKLNEYMKNNIIEISIILQNGKINYTAYGNDLTKEYIRINADYRS